MVIARFGKGNSKWFNFHRGFVVTGLVLVLIAWCIGVFRLGTGTHLAHFALGTTAFIMLLFQPINGVFRPHAPAQGETVSKKRLLWNLLHHWNGRTALLFALINTYIGFSIVDLGRGVIAVYSVVVILFAIIFLVLQWRSLRGPDTLPFKPSANPSESHGGSSI